MLTEIKGWVSYFKDRAVWGADHAKFERASDRYYRALEGLGGKTGEDVTMPGVRRLLQAKIDDLKAHHLFFGIPFDNPRYHEQVERFQRASALNSAHDFDVVIDWLNQVRLHSLENLLAWEPERMEAAISGNSLKLWDGTQNGAIATMIYGRDRMSLAETKIPIDARIYFGTKAAITLLNGLRPDAGIKGSEEQGQPVPEQIQVLEQRLRPLLRALSL